MLVRPTADQLIVWLADWLPVRPILTVSLVADWLSDPRLTVRPTADLLTDWLAGWLTVSLTDWLPVRPTADRLADWLTVSLTDWLPVRPTADWLTDCLSDLRLTDWLASWLAFCTTDWLTVWMSDYLSELLIEWIIDYLCNRNAFGHSIRKKPESKQLLTSSSSRKREWSNLDWF